MNTQIELRNKAHTISREARALLDTATDETRGEIEAKFDRMIAEADALEARAQRYDNADRIEAAYEVEDERRPSEERSIKPEDRADREGADYRSYLIGEKRAQSTLVPADGGYLVPKLYGSEIIKAMVDHGPTLDPNFVKLITTTGGNDLNYPSFDPSQGAAVKIAQNTKAGGDNLAFGDRPLNVEKWTSKSFVVPTELLQDSAFDVPSLVAEAIASRFSLGINADLTTGTTGIATLAATGVTAASATAVTGDEMIDLVHSLGRAYRRNAVIQMNDQSLRNIRKLKGSDGQYIWSQGINAGEAGTILGHRIEINPALPNMGVGANAILFGDHKRYMVRQVGGFVIKRLNEVYAESDQTAFVAFWRIGGNLMDLNAVKALKMKAS